MFFRLPVYLFVLWFSSFAATTAAQNLPIPTEGHNNNPQVVIDTNYGRVVLELFADKAPTTVNNFLAYVESGHYNNTLIHRVSKDFIIQGGAYDANLSKKAQRNAIAIEVAANLPNHRGTIAAARKLSEANSATSEFFINVVDNPQLDFQSNVSSINQGFAVFGKIIEGMDVIDKIRKVATTTKPGFPGLPISAVVIRSVSRVSK
jgi:cyclophilin family peptidyl-prolyl cis-trans isomerase